MFTHISGPGLSASPGLCSHICSLAPGYQHYVITTLASAQRTYRVQRSVYFCVLSSFLCEQKIPLRTCIWLWKGCVAKCLPYLGQHIQMRCLSIMKIMSCIHVFFSACDHCSVLSCNSSISSAGVSPSSSVVISRKKAADTGSLLTHFICLALGLLSMKQMERNCIISRMEWLSAAYLIIRVLPQFLLSLGCVRAIVSGRRGLPDTLYYPDWLVLSARLLVQPSCGQVKIVQQIYIWSCSFSGYVKILQPVAICTVIFVTPAMTNSKGFKSTFCHSKCHISPLYNSDQSLWSMNATRCVWIDPVRCFTPVSVT